MLNILKCKELSDPKCPKKPGQNQPIVTESGLLIAPGWAVGEGRLTAKRREDVLYLDCSKQKHFILCKLYLNKTDFKK